MGGGKREKSTITFSKKEKERCGAYLRGDGIFRRKGDISSPVLKEGRGKEGAACRGGLDRSAVKPSLRRGSVPQKGS